MTSKPLVLGGLVAVLLSACSDKSATNSTGARVAEPEVKTLTAEKPPPAESPSSAPTVATRQEAAERAIIQKIATALKTTRDSYDRANLLGKAKELGPEGKVLWPEIVASLKDEESLARSAALEALAAIDPSEARPHLEKGLSDPEFDVRQKAAEAWGIAKIGELGPLFKFARSEVDARVQVALLRTIEQLGKDYHVAEVGKLLDVLDPAAARPAVRFLAAQKSTDHAPEIVELLNYNDADLRADAARALAALEANSKPVYRALVRALGDDDRAVRQAAAEALKSLSGQPLPFDPDAPEDRRAAQALAWREWVDNSG